MQIGILGSGITAQTLGSRLVQQGHEVLLGSREEAKPSSVTWARDAGQQALYGTFMNAAAFGEILFNCTLGMASLDALQSAGAENRPEPSCESHLPRSRCSRSSRADSTLLRERVATNRPRSPFASARRVP